MEEARETHCVKRCGVMTRWHDDGRAPRASVWVADAAGARRRSKRSEGRLPMSCARRDAGALLYPCRARH
jgi:hypothetical protein